MAGARTTAAAPKTIQMTRMRTVQVLVLHSVCIVIEWVFLGVKVSVRM
jgi:hypothetical protein